MPDSSPRSSTERQPDISREDRETGGRYVVRIDGHEAEMTFSKAGQHLIIIDHTAVPDELRGLGIGSRLVLRAVEDARKAGQKIIPLCPYAASEFTKHPEYQDVASK
ncbi:MAG TPA: GNAT family N-acetyltransferase [Afifellaceae bacterium]|nr:GNAT family N-acetyltransferase [Afifellaceae bacterium]